ncbi:hypothetical protein PInf_001172 [Phytophthora infestans]|nr:hypothetical protein PInf_001172 [Phytophthora infestans]
MINEGGLITYAEDEHDNQDEQEEQDDQEESLKLEDQRRQRIHSCRVTDIRKMSAIGDFIWRDEIERVYLAKDGNLPLFCLASAALSDKGVTRLHSIVRDTLRTSGIRAFEIFNEAEKVVLVDEGMEAVAREYDAVDNAELRREIMVIKLKKNNFDKEEDPDATVFVHEYPHLDDYKFWVKRFSTHRGKELEVEIAALGARAIQLVLLAKDKNIQLGMNGSALKQVFDLHVSHCSDLRRQVAEAEDRLGQSSTVPRADTPNVDIFDSDASGEDEEESDSDASLNQLLTQQRRVSTGTDDIADMSYEPQTDHVETN